MLSVNDASAEDVQASRLPTDPLDHCIRHLFHDTGMVIDPTRFPIRGTTRTRFASNGYHPQGSVAALLCSTHDPQQYPI